MTTERRVYVIELSNDAGPRTGSKYQNVYVGETGLTPEARFEKHKAGGHTASKTVTQYGIRLRPDLYQHLPVYRTEAESVAAEKQLREELLEIGYTVFGGTKGFAESMAERQSTPSEAPGSV